MPVASSHLKRKTITLSGSLVIAWLLYLVVASLFKINEPDQAAGEVKNTNRLSKSAIRAFYSENADDAKSTTHLKNNDSEVAKAKKEAALKKLAAQKKQQSEDLEILQKGQRSTSQFNNLSLVEDETEILRDAFMDEATRIALRSGNPWQNLITIAKEYHRIGDKVSTRETLEKASSLAIYPGDQVRSAKAMLEIMKAMLSLDHPSLAEAALENIQNPAEQQTAMGAAASWAAVKGDIEMARRMIKNITNQNDRDTALVSLAASEATHETTAISIQTAYTISNSKKKDSAFQKIAIARGSLGDYDSSVLAIQQISDEKVRERTHVTLAKFRARSGDLEGSLGTIQHLKNSDVADLSLRDLSQQLAISGRFSNSAFVSNHIRGDSQRSQALEKLSVEQAKSGDLSGSLSHSSAIPLETIRNRSMITLSSITANQSSTGQARNIASMINIGIQRDRAYKAIAIAAASTGDHTDAYNTLQQISRPEEKAHALISLARTRQKQGDTREAYAMLEDASRISQYIQTGKTLDKIVTDMSIAYAERNDSEHSLSLASTITSEKERDKAYLKLASTFANTNIDAAQYSILSISAKKTRTSAEDAVAKAWAKKTDPQVAIHEARSLETHRQKIVFLLEVSRLL